MKRTIVIMLALAGMVLGACNERVGELERMAQAFSKEKITVPDGLVRVFDGETSAAEIRKDLPKMIYWFDSTQCSMCNAKRLSTLDKLFALSEEESPFEILLVFSPEIKDVKKTVETMSLFDLAHPVLVDINQSFMKLNPVMEEYPFFHRFYVDKKGHPQFVGDPISSDAMWELFEKTVQKAE